jgi:hypothetical protein
MHQSKKAKTLADSYELDLVEEISFGRYLQLPNFVLPSVMQITSSCLGSFDSKIVEMYSQWITLLCFLSCGKYHQC